MPRQNSKPELELRRELHRRGLRFRVNLKGLPGTPDIALTRAKVAVFVDGCFWHGCPIHYVAPKNNRDWWEAKIASNRDRDRRVDEELGAMGWVPVHVWEHCDLSSSAEEIWRIWLSRLS